MASVVNAIGYGGQQFAEKYLGWNRNTIRKGREELDRGIDFVGRYQRCGRKKAEHYHPELLIHIQAIVEPSGQTDPTFHSARLYTPLTANEVRHRLITQYGYRARELPCIRTISTKLNDLGYHPQVEAKAVILRRRRIMILNWKPP